MPTTLIVSKVYATINDVAPRILVISCMTCGATMLSEHFYIKVTCVLSKKPVSYSGSHFADG